jgi:hypothetical protein
MTGREGEPAKAMGITAMDSVFRLKAPTGLNWKALYYNDETHNSMIFRTLYDGLKYTYYGYSKAPMEFHPQNGVIQPGKPVKINFFGDLLKDLRYTVDGTQPNAGSIQVDSNSFLLQRPARVIVRAMNYRKFDEQQDTANFISGKMFPATQMVKGFTAGGWDYTYYGGNWTKMPNFEKHKPLLRGRAGAAFSLDNLPKKQNFGLVLQGQLLTDTAGYYIFGLDAHGAARLFIDDKLLVSGEGMQAVGQFKSYVVPLAKGLHKFRLEYWHQLGKASYEIVWDRPDDKNGGNIPLALQYGKGK